MSLFPSSEDRRYLYHKLGDGYRRHSNSEATSEAPVESEFMNPFHVPEPFLRHVEPTLWSEDMRVVTENVVT